MSGKGCIPAVSLGSAYVVDAAEPDIAIAYRDDPTSRFTDAMSPFFR